MVENPEDTEAAEHMLLASYMAGFSFSNASLGLVHALRALAPLEQKGTLPVSASSTFLYRL
jgi:hypothetical protein